MVHHKPHSIKTQNHGKVWQNNVQALKHTQPLTTYDTYHADILEIREKSPSGRFNSNYIIL